MEVGFRSCSFLFMGDLQVPAVNLPGCMLKPLCSGGELKYIWICFQSHDAMVVSSNDLGRVPTKN